MRVNCLNCNKVFDIPDERLPMGKKIVFPCPDCKGSIELDLTSKPAINADLPTEKKLKDRLTGQALKKKI